MMYAMIGALVVCLKGLLAVVVPVGKVMPIVDTDVRVYPGRVVSVAEVSIIPQVSGEILEVMFRNGQMAKAGDVLYRIDSEKYNAAQKGAAAKVAQIKASLEYVEKQASRYRELIKTRAVPQDDFDRVCSECDVQRAALAAAEADLLAAKDDVKHCTVIAPISGQLGSTAFTEGNFVSRGGSPLVKLVQTDPVRVSFRMSSVDYASAFGSDSSRLMSDGRVSLSRVSGGEAIVTGRIEYVENVADAATDSVTVFALVENGKGVLIDGQTVMVTLSNSKGSVRASVPPNAVALDARGAYVWVVGPKGEAEQRRVVRGSLRGGSQLIRSGLEVGESVVLDGVHRVRARDVITAEE